LQLIKILNSCMLLKILLSSLKCEMLNCVRQQLVEQYLPKGKLTVVKRFILIKEVSEGMCFNLV